MHRVPSTTAASQAASSSPYPVLLGDSSVEASVVSSAAGRAEAFPFVASAPGTIASADLYVDATNRASTINLGVYTDASGRPASLLSTGSKNALVNGAWNQFSLSAALLSSGRTYWLAILGQGDQAAFRVRKARNCTSVTSAQSNLSSLPGSWTTARSWSLCHISVFAVGAAVAPPAPTASFTSSPAIPVTGQAVHFDAGASTCAAAPCSYSWADNPPSGGSWALGSGQTLDFSFQGAGTKYVTLTVTDASSRTAAIEHDVIVTASSTSAPINTAMPVVSGTTTQGQTLTSTNGTWNNSPSSYTYQWQDCDNTGNSCSNITGATSTSHMLASTDVGHTMRAIVTATNSGGSTPAASAQTAGVATVSSGGGSNCAPTVTAQQTSTTSASFGWGSTTACGYPTPSTAGVPSGTSLTTVSSITCRNQTVNAVSFTGSSGNIGVGSGCTIQNSRIQLTDGGNSGGMPTAAGMRLLHDEISGAMTGSNCTNPTGNLVQGGPVTVSYSYLHCTGEDVNYDVNVDNSVLIADGPCSDYGGGCGAPPHYEAVYINGGGRTALVTDEHDTLINPQWQTAVLFGDDHYQPPLTNWTIDNNLIVAATHGIDSGCPNDGESGITTTNNRFAYIGTNSPTSSSGTQGGVNPAMTWSNNYLDSNQAQISPHAGCG